MSRSSRASRSAPGGASAPLDAAEAARLAADEDVLRHRQVGAEVDLLVDRADPGLLRLGGATPHPVSRAGSLPAIFATNRSTTRRDAVCRTSKTSRRASPTSSATTFACSPSTASRANERRAGPSLGGRRARATKHCARSSFATTSSSKASTPVSCGAARDETHSRPRLDGCRAGELLARKEAAQPGLDHRRHAAAGSFGLRWEFPTHLPYDRPARERGRRVHPRDQCERLDAAVRRHHLHRAIPEGPRRRRLSLVARLRSSHRCRRFCAPPATTPTVS